MIIGIDLGTTFSLASYYDGTRPQLIPNPQGAFLTPSEIHFAQSENPNDPPKFAIGHKPTQGDFPHSIRFFKEFMGTDKEYQVGEEHYTPTQLSALLLMELKSYAETHLGQNITEAVISVPAYFNDNQRIATKQAGQLAGLATTRLVNEPSAAALAYQFGFDEASLLIFDFGGGTFDVSVVDCFDNIIEIQAIGGDNHLGGKSIDQAMADYFCQECHPQPLSHQETDSILRDMETIKEQLSQQSQILYTFQGKSLVFTRPLLRQLFLPLFSRMKSILAQALRDSNKTIHHIDQIILVGGSSRLYGLAPLLQDLTGKAPLHLKNPQTVVALGMGYYVGMKQRSESLRELILTDVCPFSVGIATVHHKQDSQAHLTPIISRNSTLPITATSCFTNVHHNQTNMTLGIYLGESYFAKENLHLATLSLKLEPAPIGEATVDVSFTYDLNGILHVEVEGGLDNINTTIYSKLAKEFTQEERQQAEEKLRRFKATQDAPELHPLIRKANGFFATIGYLEKDFLRTSLDEFRKAQFQGAVQERKAYRKLDFLLDTLAQWEENHNFFYQDYLFADFLADLPHGEFSLSDFQAEEDDSPPHFFPPFQE